MRPNGRRREPMRKRVAAPRLWIGRGGIERTNRSDPRMEARDPEMPGRREGRSLSAG
ncbi:hypothetical protein chiPu_0033693, partial [Chiloscyllium punctatum]|nr:hypothetical protein [Chiloscyllium punctatum]